MVAPSTLRIAALVLGAAAAVAAAFTFPQRITAAPAAPQVAVVGHARYWAELNPDRDHIPRSLTLRITGSHFVPGSKVGIAVINTSRWTVIARGQLRAERPYTIAVCEDKSGHAPKLCSRANPRAGSFEYRVRLNSPPAAANVEVLYRSTGDPGLQSVTLR